MAVVTCIHSNTISYGVPSTVNPYSHRGLDEELENHILKTAGTLQMDVLAMEVMPDHIHLLVSCKPQLRLSDAIKILKGNSARWLFMEHTEVKKPLWGGHLWNPSYFVATVSDRSEEQVKKYIQTQKTR